MSETLMLVASGVGILLAGVGIGYWYASSRVQIRIAEAEEIRGKFDAYRRDVTEHFGRTAEHFQAIGKQYRELYEHLASGADSFCDIDTLDDKLAYEPTSAIADTGANPDAPPSERPRDYAEGDYADDEAAVESAASVPSAETPREAAAAEAAPAGTEGAAEQASPEHEASEEDKPATPANGSSGGDAAKQDRQETALAEEDAADAADDLKPEVKSDAEEKSPQPTLH